MHTKHESETVIVEVLCPFSVCLLFVLDGSWNWGYVLHRRRARKCRKFGRDGDGDGSGRWDWAHSSKMHLQCPGCSHCLRVNILSVVVCEI